MNINELYNSIPEELHGNIAVSASRVSITGRDGKAQAFELGAEVEGKAAKGFTMIKAREVKGCDGAVLAASYVPVITN
jgi:hypothetical protein